MMRLSVGQKPVDVRHGSEMDDDLAELEGFTRALDTLLIFAGEHGMQPEDLDAAALISRHARLILIRIGTDLRTLLDKVEFVPVEEGGS